MSKPFDATTKLLVELRPADWLAYLGLPSAPVTVIDADLATVTADADRLLLLLTDPPEIIHIEFETGHEANKVPGRLLRYNVLTHYDHHLPVRSVVFLLRREADSPALTGDFTYRRADDSVYLTFAYQVVRLWEQPIEALLRGGLATLPLAPLAAVSPADLPAVIERMEGRIAQEASDDEAGILWTAAYVLMGLRYPVPLTNRLLRGVRQMKESLTYQAILEEGMEKGRREGETQGREAGARATILRQGGKRFGVPSATVTAQLAAIHAFEELETLAERLLEAESWEELLGV